MRSIIREIALSAVAVTLVVAGVAQANDDVVSNAIIQRAGLQVEWSTHSGAGARSRIVDWHLNVNENKATTFYSITAGKFRETFSENKLNSFGKPLSQDESYGVSDYIDVRKKVLTAELKHLGVENPEIKIDQYSLPESTIYLYSSTGSVSAIDADTGALKWQNRVGKTAFMSVGVGADNNHVAVINGSTLYCLTADSGKLLFSAKCRHGVSAGPSVSWGRIYVPLVNGRLEVFKIKERGVNSSSFASVGESTSPPLITGKTISWTTDRGLMNVVAEDGGKAVSYQLRADDAIVGQPVYQSGVFFVTSLDGFIYALDEDRGSVKWQVSTGASISQSPAVFGGFVYVVNDNNELFKLDVKQGYNAPGWESPRSGVGKIVGAGQKDIFVTDKVGNLKVLSQSSGAVLSSVPFGSVDKVLANQQSDRLYFANRQGLVQCIREVASEVPHFHTGEFGSIEVATTKVSGRSEAGEKPKKDDGGDLEDPFKAGDDPFAGGGEPVAEPEEDPFAGGADDAGGSADDAGGAEDDPFAGGVEDDPFQ